LYTEVFIDGASRNNGVVGREIEAACACVIYKNRKEVVRFARGLGSRTNNEAEYEALLAALLLLVMSDLSRPIIYSDSAVVVNQVKGLWACRAPGLLPLYLSVKEIEQQYPFDLRQVSRNRVFLPDELCNQFLDQLEAEKQILKLAYSTPTETETNV
jgi:ribonuclease HI